MTMAEISRDQVCVMAPGKLKSMIAEDLRMMMSAEEGRKLEKTQKGPPSSVLSLRLPQKARERSKQNNSASLPAQPITNGRATHHPTTMFG